MGPTIKIITKSDFGQKFRNFAYSENLSIRRAPREAKNLGIFTLTIRLSSNFVKIHTSGVNRINIWVLGPGDTAENSKRHGLRFWTSADFVILYIGNIQLPIDRTAADMLHPAHFYPALGVW